MQNKACNFVFFAQFCPFYAPLRAYLELFVLPLPINLDGGEGRENTAGELKENNKEKKNRTPGRSAYGEEKGIS